MFSPPKKFPTAEWMTKNFRLPSISGDIDGLYQFKYAPYFLGVAAALDDPKVREVDLQKASQLGWTYFIIGYMLKRIYEASIGKQLPIMTLFAKEKDGISFNKEKFVPTVQANPSMDGLLDVSTSRKSGNCWDFKSFVNGFLKFVGSNSPGNVQSTSSVGLGIVEEPDDTSDNVKERGDSIGHIQERLKRYLDSMLIVGGTPSLAGFSKIEARIKLSDARILPITCHNCNEKHVLSFQNVDWVGKSGELNADKETGEILTQPHEIYGFSQPETAVYVCPHCDSEWDDYQRHKNIQDTCFNAQAAGDINCGWTPTKPFYGKAGFTELPEVYSCLPGSGLAELVIDYLDAEYHAARGDETKKIKFINQKEGKTYEYKGDEAEPDIIRDAALDYPEMVIPLGGLKLSAGIDIQHNRLAIVIRAWGRDEESWNIYWDELFAENTTIDKNDPVWISLEKLLFAPIKSVEGWSTYIESLTLDCSDGVTSAAAYIWVRKMTKKYKKVLVMAGKGSSSQGDPEIFVTPKLKSIDHKNPKKQTKADKHGVKIYIIGTNKAKDWIAGQIKLEVNPKTKGLWHFRKDIRDDYYDQITGEVKVPDKNRKKWKQKEGAAVEALDCEVYCRHAAMAKRVHLLTPGQWDDIENTLKQTDLFSSVVEPTDSSGDIETSEDDDLSEFGQHFNG